MAKRLFLLLAILLSLVVTADSAKIISIWTGFQAGELSPYLDGQVNFDKYTQGAKTMQNFFPRVQGPVSNRSGFRHIADLRSVTEEIITLANSMKTIMNAHAADNGGAGEHGTAVDAVNFPLASSDATSLATAYTLIGEMLVDYDAHNDDAQLGAAWAFHNAQVDDYDVDSAVTPTTEEEAVTRISDLLSKYNSHEASAVSHTAGGQHTEILPAPSNTVRAARLIPFEFSTDQAYILEFGDHYIRYYMNGGQIISIPATTVLLLEMNGTDATTTFTDESDTPHTVTAMGSAQLDTEYRKFGSAAGLFDGAGDYLTIPDHADFDFSGLSWSFDTWIRPQEVNSDPYTIFSQRTDATHYIELYLDSQAALLLHMDGADTSTTFTDSAINPTHTVTANGHAQLDTAQYKFRTASGYFDGAGDYLTIPDHADFDFSGGVFTMDFWIRPYNYSSGFQGIWGQRTDSTHYISIRTDPGGGVQFYTINGVATDVTLTANAVLTNNNWHHVAIVEDGNNWYLFIDGVQKDTDSSVVRAANLGGNILIGANYNASSGAAEKYFDGWIDEFRVIGGLAVWTSPFTPPASRHKALHPIFVVENGGATSTLESTGVDTIDYDGWQHIEVGGDGADHYLFAGGVEQDSGTLANNPANYTQLFLIGAFNEAGPLNYFKGSMDELRIVNGLSVHTADFVPPIQEYLLLGDTPYETVTTYTEAELPELQYTQSADYLYIVHPNHKPSTLTRTGHTAWTFTEPYVWDGAEPGSWAVGSYPSSVVFFEQRLWLAYLQTLWATESGDYDDLANGLEYTIASNQVNTIQWLTSGKILVAGTAGGEYKISASSQDEAITDTNIRVVRQSSYGSAYQMPHTVKDVTLYLQRASRKIREFAYEFTNDIYVSQDMTLLAEHITESGIKDMAYQQEPFSILWTVRNDGNIAGMTYSRENDVVAWHEHTTDGDFESVAVIPSIEGNNYDELWVIVERDINGSTERYVELLDPQFEHDDDIEDAFFVDSGLSYNGVAASTISGLDHLEGETVAILADGAVQTSKTVSSGSITLDTAASKVSAGLPYTSTLQTMRWEGKTNLGTAQGRKKRINKAVFRLENAKQFKYGHTPTGDTNEYTFTNMYSGDQEVEMPHDNNREGHVTVINDKPLPITIISIMPEVNISP